MNEDYVIYEIAKKLKEKGFKEKCFAYYFPKGSELFFNHNPFRGGIVEDCLYSNNSLPNECMASDFVDAPTISQVLKWLREKKVMHIVCPFCEGNGFYFYVQEFGFGFWHNTIMDSSDYYATFEQAALAGIWYVLDNLI